MSVMAQRNTDTTKATEVRMRMQAERAAHIPRKLRWAVLVTQAGLRQQLVTLNDGVPVLSDPADDTEAAA